MVKAPHPVKMSFGSPAYAKIEINRCAPRRLMDIPGVGPKICDAICQIREDNGNITPEEFATLGIKNLPAAMERVDFSALEDDDYPNAASPGPNLATMSTPARGHYPAFPNPWASYPPMHPGIAPGMFGYQMPVPAAANLDHSLAWLDQMATPTRPKSEIAPRRVDAFSVIAPRRFDAASEIAPRRVDASSRIAPHRVDAASELAPHRFDAARDDQSSNVKLPRRITFDGKGDWQVFISKFTDYADRERWNTNNRMYALSMQLEGVASRFFSTTKKRNPTIDYFEMISKLAKRFDLKDLQETSLLKFQSAEQDPKDSLVEWADKLSTLAAEAYLPEVSDEQVSKHIILQFCKGCTDKQAGFHTINQKPASIDEAIELVTRYQQSSRAMYGSARKVQATFAEDPEDEGNYSARAVTPQQRRQFNKPRPERPPARLPSEYKSNTLRIENLERDMKKVLSVVGQMEGALRSMESKLTLLDKDDEEGSDRFVDGYDEDDLNENGLRQ